VKEVSTADNESGQDEPMRRDSLLKYFFDSSGIRTWKRRHPDAVIVWESG